MKVTGYHMELIEIRIYRWRILYEHPKLGKVLLFLRIGRITYNQLILPSHWILENPVQHWLIMIKKVYLFHQFKLVIELKKIINQEKKISSLDESCLGINIIHVFQSNGCSFWQCGISTRFTCWLNSRYCCYPYFHFTKRYMEIK